MSIITTMQNQQLIEDKKAITFIKKNFIEPLGKSGKSSDIRYQYSMQ